MIRSFKQLLKTLYNILCKDEQTLDAKKKVEPDLLVTSQTTILTKRNSTL